MKPFFEHPQVAARLARSRSLLAFDFDGTLAPIVQNRDLAKMRPLTKALIKTLAGTHPVGVISGRALSDVTTQVKGLAIEMLVGNHGLEPGSDLRQAKRALDGARIALGALAKRSPGVEIEDKRYSLSVHYRRSATRAAAHRAILRVAADLRAPMRIIEGKCVVNLVPADAPTKGDALLAMRAAAKTKLALYVGDDATDEDVFRLDQPSRLITVRVGHSSKSKAQYFVKNQREIDRLLELLARPSAETEPLALETRVPVL